ncbi:hypothetical protein CZP2022_260 [Vibrio phage C-ZP2022]|nr:hypothetical protein CZP2022_260 [Vibrio phage C-ZP2022]
MSLEFILDDTEHAIKQEFQFDTEKFASFDLFVDNVEEAITGTLDWLLNNHKTADIVTPDVLGVHHQKLESLGYTALRDVNVYLPPYCKTDILSYAAEIYKQLTMLHDIEQRLYDPVAEHMQFSVSLDGYHNKPMTSRDYRTVDVDKMKKDLKRVNAEGDKPEDLKAVSEVEAFGKTFRNMRGLKDTEQLMVKIGEMLSSVNLIELQKKEAVILKDLNRLLDKIAEGEKAELSAGAKKQMAQTLMQLAVETEYLSVMLFTANTAIEAWNKTVEKLRKFDE